MARGIWKARILWCFSDEKSYPSFVSSVAISLIGDYDLALRPSLEGNQSRSSSSGRSRSPQHLCLRHSCFAQKLSWSNSSSVLVDLVTGDGPIPREIPAVGYSETMVVS